MSFRDEMLHNGSGKVPPRLYLEVKAAAQHPLLRRQRPFGNRLFLARCSRLTIAAG